MSLQETEVSPEYPWQMTDNSLRESTQTKLEELPTCTRIAGHIIFQEPRPKSALLSEKDLAPIATYASLPSLERLQRQIPHSKAVAKRVTGNLRAMTGHLLPLLDSDSLDQFEDINGYNKTEMQEYERKRRVRGSLSELAVLSTLWWGVTDGHFPPDTFIFPCDRQKDKGAVTEQGRTGTDFILGISGVHVPLQVKSAAKDELQYVPGIVTLRPLELINYNVMTAARRLLEAFAGNDVKALQKANMRALKIITSSYNF
jgi:hypothetical protein